MLCFYCKYASLLCSRFRCGNCRQLMLRYALFCLSVPCLIALFAISLRQLPLCLKSLSPVRCHDIIICISLPHLSQQRLSPGCYRCTERATEEWALQRQDSSLWPNYCQSFCSWICPTSLSACFFERGDETCGSGSRARLGR